MNKSGDDIRIVQVSSVAHTFGKLDFDNIQGNKSYSRINMYGNSKLYQVRIYLEIAINRTCYCSTYLRLEIISVSLFYQVGNSF